MENYYNYSQAQELDMRVSKVMKRVYLKMFLALLVSGLVAWFTQSFALNNPGVMQTLYGSRSSMFILLLVEVGIVLFMTMRLNKISSATATVLFYVFSIINGITLSVIFLVYSPDSIVKTFMITSATFGAMSVYGYMTNKDLTRFGSFLFMALIGLIICSLVNLFMHSDSLGWIISCAGVLIFLGLTAWDTQKIKQMAMVAPSDSVGKLATIGALSLYLDFINLFLYLLRFFGNSRD